MACALFAETERRFDWAEHIPRLPIGLLFRSRRLEKIRIFRMRSPLAPLLEEKRDVGRCALVADGAEPIGMRRPRAGAGFAARDDPIQARTDCTNSVNRIEVVIVGFAGFARCNRFLD